jgi:hypothetical protein
MSKIALMAAAALIVAGGAQAGPKSTAPGPVFVIAMENHNFIQPAAFTEVQQIYHNPAAPFINSLVKPGHPNAQYVSYAVRYQNVVTKGGISVHPSEPNYVWQESGVHGRLNDNDPYPDNIVHRPSLPAEMQAAGMSWKAYQEDTDLVTSAP